MSVNIGEKIYRNLQEQVGFNTAQIEKIFQILDGLSVTDNVVVISDLSSVLTSEELEIVQKAVAFIVYDGQLYIKKSEDTSKAYFDIVFTISASGGVISFASKEIEVTLSNGALAQITSTNTTYSSSQIDNLLSGKTSKTYVDDQLALKADKTNIPLENIKDAQGHNRFIEGEIDLLPSLPNGLTKTYGKWSLSGTHLMVVLAGQIANGTQVLPVPWVEIELPEWIRDKIYGVLGNEIEAKNIIFYAHDFTSQTANCWLEKKVNKGLQLFVGSITATSDKVFRIVFDLLIDNE